MKLKEYRLSAGMTQKQVADLLGISQVVYNRYEKEAREPSHDMLIAIANIYGATIDELLGREEPAAKKDPAPIGGMRESVRRLFDEISEAGLSDEEADYIRSLVSGVKALRKP